MRSNKEPLNLAGNRPGANNMTDPKDPLKDGLTPPDYDEYGDAPDSGENDPEETVEPKDEPNAGESPLG
ncbi:MAG: hypothetical protein IH827_11345 [Myxococcales bacterium]|nr:hypothetical protein [Myxococcales bacterium]